MLKLFPFPGAEIKDLTTDDTSSSSTSGQLKLKVSMLTSPPDDPFF